MENEKGFIPIPKKEYEELGEMLNKIKDRIDLLIFFRDMQKDIIDRLNELEDEAIKKGIDYDPDSLMNQRLNFIKNEMMLNEAKENYEFHKSLYDALYPV